MKKYLISLEKDIKRRELFFSQPNTADFEIFNAINTMNENNESLSLLFNTQKFSLRYGRNVTKGEVGCTLSHLRVYEKIISAQTVADNEYCLVCEDDALFTDNFQFNLDAVVKQNLTADIVLIGQSKITNFDDIELKINYPTTFSCGQKKIEETKFTYSYPYKNYFAGTVAYLIKKSAAEKILAQLSHGQLPFWLADDYILFGEEFKLDIMVIRPLMVIENPNLVSNLEDLRGSLKNNMVKKLLKYPLKKLLA
ncbi:MAG TPA: Lsg locus protein 4, partial [Pasteurellaceae bacterium]|nr:Lsg locus protein 4 [Pasteurellaceae bacterium]